MTQPAETTAPAPLLFTPAHEALRAETRAWGDTFAEGYVERALSLDFFWDLYRETGARGYLGMTVPKADGGLEASAVEAGIVIEEVSRADFNLGFALFGAYSANQLLSMFATPAMKEQWLAPALRGEQAIGFALTEPGAGSDSRNIQTRATKVDGGWRITGQKASSGFTVVAGATIVWTRTSDDPRRGITPFLVPLDSPGVARERIPNHGFRPTGRGMIGLEDVFVAEEQMLGEVGEGFTKIANSFDFTRGMIALEATGAADRAIAQTIAYVSERETFGDVLASRQGVTFPIAEHATRIEAARLLAYSVLAKADAGQPYTKEASMAKWFATEAATNAVRDMIVLHGYRGYSDELPLMQLMRDLQGLEIAEGATQIQKLIISRELFGRASGGRR